jgi:hypothetical protein
MTKTKGALILGALMIAGVTLLASFPASSASSFLLVRTWRLEKACATLLGNERDACRIPARLLERLGPLEAETDVAYVIRKMRGPTIHVMNKGCCEPCTVTTETPVCPDTCTLECTDFQGTRCEKCIASLSAIEAYLATNGTAALLADTMATACDGRFDDPATTDACKNQIQSAVPVVIDRILANAPPQTACQGLFRRACAP